MNNILVFIECKNGSVRKAAFELLSKAKEMAESVCAVALGHEMNSIAEELKPFADKIIVVDHEDLKDYRWDAYTHVLSEIIKTYTPFMVFGSSTITGKDLFPRLSARLDMPLIADATGIDYEDGIKIKKPLFGGKIISWMGFKDTALITFRPNSFPIEKRSLSGEIIKEALPVVKDPRLVITASHKTTTSKADLQEADFIICGGRGMKGPEHFTLLEEIAASMNGAVGASRAVVDSKWRDYEDQIGKSGKTVSPKIYIGCGVSGALHHTMGMDTSKTIVAINKDPTAPIFNSADYGIVDDLFVILPVLSQELKKARE
jgi:electron transfer flavoprotein alpha subunit